MAARLYQLILSIRLTFYRLLRFTSALLESRMHHFRRRREGIEFEERHSFEVRRPSVSHRIWSTTMAATERGDGRQTDDASKVKLLLRRQYRTACAMQYVPPLLVKITRLCSRHARGAYPSGARRELA